MAAPNRNAHTFNRMFKDEFLAVRKDVTPAMLAAAKGDIEEVQRILSDNLFEIGTKNKDGNTLLLIAVANGRVDVATYLMDNNADILHRNMMNMDALDYATMDGVKAPICKKVLSYCDYVIPEILESAHRVDCQYSVSRLRELGLIVVRSSIVGKLPDFSDIFSRDTEYRIEWKNALRFICNTVRKGMLLLSDDITYLERDALLCGTLEVDIRRRYVWLQEKQECVRFGVALQKVYAEKMELRMIEASSEGDATATQGLLRAKAHPNIEDAHGQTLLMRASHGGHSLVVRCLLVAGANVNTTNRDGYTSLMLAASRNHDKSVEFLLKGKADLTLKSNKGHNVFDFVQHAGNVKILRILQHSVEAQKLIKGNNKK